MQALNTVARRIERERVQILYKFGESHLEWLKWPKQSGPKVIKDNVVNGWQLQLVIMSMMLLCSHNLASHVCKGSEWNLYIVQFGDKLSEVNMLRSYLLSGDLGSPTYFFKVVSWATWLTLVSRFCNVTCNFPANFLGGGIVSNLSPLHRTQFSDVDTFGPFLAMLVRLPRPFSPQFWDQVPPLPAFPACRRTPSKVPETSCLCCLWWWLGAYWLCWWRRW